RRILALVLGLSAFVLACGRARGDVVAATEDGLWMVLDRMPAHIVAGESWVRPDRYAPVRLDGRVLARVLERAPMEGAAGAPLALMLPTPEGKFAPFGVVES